MMIANQDLFSLLREMSNAFWWSDTVENHQRDRAKSGGPLAGVLSAIWVKMKCNGQEFPFPKHNLPKEHVPYIDMVRSKRSSRTCFDSVIKRENPNLPTGIIRWSVYRRYIQNNLQSHPALITPLVPVKYPFIHRNKQECKIGYQSNKNININMPFCW